jgi:hypothetical protein
MARTFAAESGTLSGAVSAAGVTAADGGDGTINTALSNAVQAAGLATGQLAAVVKEHGGKLGSAYQHYRDAEESSTRLCQDLTNLIAGSRG